MLVVPEQDSKGVIALVQGVDKLSNKIENALAGYESDASTDAPEDEVNSQGTDLSEDDIMTEAEQFVSEAEKETLERLGDEPGSKNVMKLIVGDSLAQLQLMPSTSTVLIIT